MLPAHIDYGRLPGVTALAWCCAVKESSTPSPDHPLLQRQRLLMDPLGLFVLALTF